ncbi:hypothetical protein FOBRF1_013118 [Fusarium oxysporum]
MSATNDWKSLAARHRARQADSLIPEWLLPEDKLSSLRSNPPEGKLIESDAVKKSGLLTEKELKITEEFTATQLISKLSLQEFSSEEVVIAFIKRASLAHQLTNCLTEIFFSKAIERAKKLDEHLRATGKVTGPLHGLPISLKDPFNVKGECATAGYVEFARSPPSATNSTIVDLLFDAGAIFYCKTNVPQAQLSADSDNNIYGRTLNPHKTQLTAGGSTGGEGALIAFRGSILGVGTDIAGSVRIPALCNGAYSFKPTANRVPFANQTYYPAPLGILPGITPAAGPLANSVDDIAMFMKVVSDQGAWKYDATSLDIPWRKVDSLGKKPLVIGILPEDPTYRLHPPVRRALAAATLSLRQAGHIIVTLPSEDRISTLLGSRIAWNYLMVSGPNPQLIPERFGEPLVPSIAAGINPFAHGGIPVSTELSVPDQLCALNDLRDVYSRAWQETWHKQQLDVILGPGAVSTAAPHDTYGFPVYTIIWNLLDVSAFHVLYTIGKMTLTGEQYPAGIIPFGFASKEEDPTPQKSTAEHAPDYKPEDYDGAPCALQVITPRFRDEECIEAMRIIDRDIRRKD